VERIDALAASAAESYATKRRRLAQLRASASALRAQVAACAKAADGGAAAAVENVRTTIERARAEVDSLSAAAERADVSLRAHRSRLAARREDVQARRESLEAAAVALRAERNTLRNRHRGAAPPALRPHEAEQEVAEKRAKVQQLSREFSLCDVSIMGVRLPRDGNFLHFLRENLDPATLDLGLCHTNRFLELAAGYLCVPLPFSTHDIGFRCAGSAFWNDAADDRTMPDGESGAVEREGSSSISNGVGADRDDAWNIDVKAQQVNYNICAVFAADGMNVDTLAPELGSYFQTLPNLVACTDPARNPALGTRAPFQPAHAMRPFGQIIEVPVGEDFVRL
jgi:hypothetical protein